MKIKEEVLKKIKEHAKYDYPIEACGYLIGKEETIVNIIKMKNLDNSPEHFTFDVQEQFKVVKELRKKGLEIIGVYHTHPNTYAYMSEEDIRLANDIKLIYVIYSVKYDNFKFFKITNEKKIININPEVYI